MKSLLDWGWQLSIVSCLTISQLCANKNHPILAQVVPDNTLGSESSVVNAIDNVNDRIDGGAQRGGNLFHSFQDFNVDEGRGVYFANPAGIDNILTRVTGGNPSNILGRLGVLGGANLFLLNPNGIIFGPNSSLSIQGSFVGSTADGIVLGENGFFSATDIEGSSLLSVSPGVLFYNQAREQPGNILVEQGNLIVGKNLTLSASDGNVLGDIISPNGTVIQAGGDVFLSSYIGGSLHILAGGKVEIPGFVQIEGTGVNGLIEEVTLSDRTIVSVNGQTQATLDIRAGIANEATVATSADINVGTIFFGVVENNFNPIRGNVLLTNQFQPNTELAGNIQIVDIFTGSFEGGGNVVIDSKGGITVGGIIDTSAISDFFFNDFTPFFIGDGGDVTLFAEGDITFTSGSSIFSDGSLGGQISLKSQGRISLINGFISNYSFTDRSDVKGGDIAITARSLILTDSAQLLLGTFGAGSSGDIVVKASELVEVTGTTKIPDIPSEQQFPSALFTFTTDTGNSGNITIETERLIVRDGGQISTNTSALGNAGDINIKATEVEISGITSNAPFPSSITTQVLPGAMGNSGNLTLDAERIFIRDGGLIGNVTFGTGNTGNVNIQATEVEVFGFGTTPDSQIASSLFTAVGVEGTGNSDNLTINTERLIVRDGGQILTGTRDFGNSGNINISAREVQLIGTAPIALDFSENVPFLDEPGNLPRTIENLQRISLIEGQLSLPSLGNQSTLFPSRLSATGTGNITLETERLLIGDGAQISTSRVGATEAGNITIKGTELVEISGKSTDNQLHSSILTSITPEATATSLGGNLNLETKRLIIRDGALIDTGTRGSAPGGNLTVRASESIELTSNSGLFTGVALEATGDGGTLDIQTGFLTLDDNSQISASSLGQGNAGNITITLDKLLSVTNSNLTASAHRSAGGTINITAPNIRLFGDSNILTNVNSGTGGNITLNANDSFIASDDSDILAFARDGRGGNITLNTPIFLGNGFQSVQNANLGKLDGNRRVNIEASGTVSGLILNPIQNNLTELPENLISTETLLAKSCVIPSQKERGRFIITGSGGIPTRPGLISLSPYPTAEVRTIDDTASRPWQPGDPIIEPQGAYRLADGKLVLSRQCVN